MLVGRDGGTPPPSPSPSAADWPLQPGFAESDPISEYGPERRPPPPFRTQPAMPPGGFKGPGPSTPYGSEFAQALVGDDPRTAPAAPPRMPADSADMQAILAALAELLRGMGGPRGEIIERYPGRRQPSRFIPQ